MTAYQDLDDRIDWPSFYQQRVGSMKPSGHQKMSGHCPFGTHKDKHPSFWINTTNGLYKCEACGASGNPTTFLAQMENLSNADAYRKLCELAGVDREERKPGTYTVKEYALEKRLPGEFLQSLGLRNGRGNRFVEIPYMDAARRVLAIRKRMPPGAKQRFLWNKGAKPCLYGLWRLREARDAGYVVLVEGESDAQTLWLLGIPALGIPGASTFSAVHAQAIMDIPIIYVHIEPDLGGQTVKRKVAEALRESGYTGGVGCWSCSAHQGIKDPSQLYCADERNAAEIMRRIMREAEIMNAQALQVDSSSIVDDAPIQLRTPPGYELCEGGIYTINLKTGCLEVEPFCWTPLLITGTTAAEDGSVKLGLAFRRDGHWHSLRVPRDLVMTSRSVVKLSSYGADVHSENASALVKWFSALERANVDRIPKRRSVAHYGWVDGGTKQFLPFAAGEHVFDSDGYEQLAHVGKQTGTLAGWLATMLPHRERPLFRFILANGFTAPLLRILGQRIFVVYNWCDSKGGKTASLYAALSIWGNPEDLCMSFNATNVAIERTIQFYSDLPLGLNERQLAGNKQDFLDKLVYTLSEGKSRSRGAREGGLQHQGSWRSVIIANGEEPLAGDASQSGVLTRAMELLGKPFDHEPDAAAMYGAVASHHGHAGQKFMERLIAADQDWIREMHGAFANNLGAMRAQARNHVFAVAAVCVADVLASYWVFDLPLEEAREAAFDMGLAILKLLEPPESQDVNRRALEFLRFWIQSNLRQFSCDFSGPTRYGSYEGGDHFAYIHPNVFNEALERQGFSAKKTRRWLATSGLISTSSTSSGKTLDTVQRRIDGHNMRVIELDMSEDALSAVAQTKEIEEAPFR